MGISYEPLWHLLIKKKLIKTDLVRIANLSPNTVAKLSKNQYIDVRTLERICATFQCQPGDVLEYIPDSEEEKNG